ncbi:MAG: T9SS type A sorting domain-containing protein, partial [Bacteroidales bacterium]
LIIEDFETGDFSLYDWQLAGNQAWTVTGLEKFEGDFSAKSGTIGNGETSEMSLSLVIAGDDSIAFFRKLSSQPNADYLRFYIDEVLWDEASGETEWIRAAAPVSEGLHMFRWVYSKNQNTSTGSDCAWVDFIDLPASVGIVTVNAGTDASVCEAVAFQTVATAENYNNVLWETSGDGLFDDPNILNAVYTPGAEDLTNGIITLSLTADGPAQQTLTDDLQLTIMPLPAQAAVINGQSIVCMDGENSYSTEIITFSDSYVWSLSPAEAGTISGNGTEISIQWTTSWTGMASIAVQGMNSCGVGGPSELFLVQVDDCTGIDDLAGTAFTISPNPGNGLIQLNFAEAIGKPLSIRIVNLTGEKVFEALLSGRQNETIDARGLQNGIYFMLIDQDNNRISRKIVIQ